MPQKAATGKFKTRNAFIDAVFETFFIMEASLRRTADELKSTKNPINRIIHEETPSEMMRIKLQEHMADYTATNVPPAHIRAILTKWLTVAESDFAKEEERAHAEARLALLNCDPDLVIGWGNQQEVRSQRVYDRAERQLILASIDSRKRKLQFALSDIEALIVSDPECLTEEPSLTSENQAVRKLYHFLNCYLSALVDLVQNYNYPMDALLDFGHPADSIDDPALRDYYTQWVNTQITINPDINEAAKETLAQLKVEI